MRNGASSHLNFTDKIQKYESDLFRLDTEMKGSQPSYLKQPQQERSKAINHSTSWQLSLATAQTFWVKVPIRALRKMYGVGQKGGSFLFHTS